MIVPRPTKQEELKKQTKATIIKALEEKGNCEKYLLDQVDEYMQFYENLQTINDKLSKSFNAELVKEKRLIAKEMRNILTFLGLKPVTGNGDGSFEEL